ncbi:MAG: hypothetical protein KF757_11030 [Phycisphaeraceae bacterium]|nr:hypothetical protein [Phycisphaeraceae bacterium]MCW5762223.1 hypothetical protein [Phycisphaeraceae bacterium]
MQGFASVLQSGSGIGAFGGLSMSGLLGGLASIGSSTLIGMGFDKIAGLAMSAWAVDDESSTGEHLAHMATQKLMGELQSHAQSALMEAVLSPSSPAAPGSDASTLDQAREYVMGKARSSGIAIAHNTSPTDHGGVLTATAAKTLAGGLTVGRLNDVQACPLFNGSTPHVGGPVNTANPTVIAEGLAVTGEDHTALCTGVGGQTLLKPTVQNVRIGTTGMPVAISSMGEDDDAAKVEAQKASDQSNNENPSEQACDESAAQSSEGAADEDHALGCDPEHQSCEPPAEDGQMCQASADEGQMCEDPNGASAAQSQTPEQQIESAKQEAGELADGSVIELELAKGGDPEAQERVSRHFKLDPNDPKYDAKVDQLIKDYEIGKSKIDSGNYVVDNGLSGGPAGAQVSCNIWGCGDEVRINPDSLGKGSDDLGGSILHENMHRAGKVPWKWDWSKGWWVNNEVYYKPSGTFPGDSYNAARKQATTYDRFARDVAKNRR